MALFYHGDIKSGISAAVQQSKLVTCFVRDDGEESTIWETEYLQDETLRALLLENTFLLRLQAGSQEADFLAAIYPIPKSPTLVIIHSNGQLKEYLTKGISKADFLQRVKVALNGRQEISTIGSDESVETPTSSSPGHQPMTSTNSQGQLNPELEQSLVVRDLLVERGARLEAQKREQDATEKAERAAKAKARKEAIESAANNTESSKKAAEMKFALMQKKRQEAARNERARILQRVEDDKIERRVKDALRREQARALEEADDMESSIPMEPTSSNLRQSLKNQGGFCAIQVRLFDGTTIRSRFSFQSTLRHDVRQWVDGQRTDGDIPYIFKQVLTPYPNRTITVSEEEESLQSLGITFSATLIMEPVKNYTSAYESSATSYFSRGLSNGLGLVSSSMNMVTRTLGSLVGGGIVPSDEVEPENLSSLTSAVPKVRTFQEQTGLPEEHQLYNGNTLNFEPRRDDDVKED